MNTSTTFNKPLAQDASNFAESAADNASGAIRSTQNVANAAFDRLNDKVESARDQVAPMISRLSDQAEAVARRGAECPGQGAVGLGGIGKRPGIGEQALDFGVLGFGHGPIMPQGVIFD